MTKLQNFAHKSLCIIICFFTFGHGGSRASHAVGSQPEPPPLSESVRSRVSHTVHNAQLGNVESLAHLLGGLMQYQEQQHQREQFLSSDHESLIGDPYWASSLGDYYQTLTEVISHFSSITELQEAIALEQRVVGLNALQTTYAAIPQRLKYAKTKSIRASANSSAKACF